MSSYVFTTDWFTPHIPLFQKQLSTLVDKEHVQFLEIGSWEGRSACWILDNILTHPTACLTCIDTFQGSREHHNTTGIEERFDHNIRQTGSAYKVTKLKGKSTEVLTTLPSRYYDCIYIDGSHIASDVLTDIIASWRLLKDNGLMILDDYKLKLFTNDCDNPQYAIDAFLQIFHAEIRTQEIGWQIALRKRPRPMDYPPLRQDFL